MHSARGGGGGRGAAPRGGGRGARPSTAASSVGSGVRGALSPRGGRGGGGSGGSGGKEGDAGYTAKKLKELEAEMAQLRSTIDTLYEAQGGAVRGSSPPPVFLREGTATMAPVSGLRVGDASLSAGAPAESVTARAKLAVALHDENMHIESVQSTLSDKHRHDKRVVALQKESMLLQDPATLAAAAGSQYTRDPLDNLMQRTAASAPPLLAPPAVAALEAGDRNRRASMASVPSGGGGGGALRRGSLGGVSDGGAVGAGAGAFSVKRAASPATAAARASALRPLSAAESVEVATAAAAPVLAAASASAAAGGAPAPSAPRPTTAPAAARRGGDHHPGQVRAAAPAATRPAPAPAGGGAPSSPAAAGGAASPSRRALSPERKPTKKELEAQYAGLPGLSKKVAATTVASGFVFSASKKGIREAKVQDMIDAKRAADEAAATYKFKAMPIAPATADLGLFNRIMEKQAARRAKEHAEKAAYAAAHFKPFTIVTAHCDEHAARQAARHAKEELEAAREREAMVKFKANPMPTNTARPAGMLLGTVKKKAVAVALVGAVAKPKEVVVEKLVTQWLPASEAGRAERCSAAARASAALASLPPRMALADERTRQRGVERAARLAAEEAAERAAAAFHPVQAPDFARLQATFARSCSAARVRVTSAWKPVATEPFSFDLPERAAKDAERRDVWVREFERSTSRSLDVRRRSIAYEKGEDLAGDKRPGSAPPPRAGRKGTLGVNPYNEATAALSATRAASAALRRRHSVGGGGGNAALAAGAASTAPPATMTRSVKLKMAAVQARLREQQEAALAKEVADERYADVDRAATAKLAPTFQALERERLTDPETGQVKKLSWYLDHVTAAASERRRIFVEETKKNAARIRERVEAAKSNRPLVMCVPPPLGLPTLPLLCHLLTLHPPTPLPLLPHPRRLQASIDNAKVDGRKAALLKLQRAVSAGGSRNLSGGENSGLFDEEELALMAAGGSQ